MTEVIECSDYYEEDELSGDSSDDYGDYTIPVISPTQHDLFTLVSSDEDEPRTGYAGTHGDSAHILVSCALPLVTRLHFLMSDINPSPTDTLSDSAVSVVTHMWSSSDDTDNCTSPSTSPESSPRSNPTTPVVSSEIARTRRMLIESNVDDFNTTFTIAGRRLSNA